MKLLPYTNLQDLRDMLDLLAAGRKADNGTYYVHRGDLQWWLFYLSADVEWQPNIRLIRENGQLLAWTLLSMEDNAIDVYVKPELRGTDIERELFAWAAEQMSAQGGVDAYWIAEDDFVRQDWLRENGFTVKEAYTVLLKRDLSDRLDLPAMPEGFALRTSRGTEEDARLRSVASYAAFESSRAFDEYIARTWKFMQSPVYVPEHEILLDAPDGQVAAFCCIWTDELNKVGNFEPVGTHPNFQRRGLGRALLLDSLRRLKLAGMETATVCTGSANAPAIALYESVGFRPAKKLLTFSKRKS